MQDAGAGGHPLGVAIRDQTAAAGRVLMLEGSVDHVGDRLEPAVRMQGRALRLARSVLNLAHLIHMDEGVEELLIQAVKGPSHRKALALQALWGGRDGDHGACASAGRVQFRDTRQRQNVLDRHGGHDLIDNRWPRCGIPVPGGAIQ